MLGCQKSRKGDQINCIINIIFKVFFFILLLNRKLNMYNGYMRMIYVRSIRMDYILEKYKTSICNTLNASCLLSN